MQDLTGGLINLTINTGKHLTGLIIVLSVLPLQHRHQHIDLAHRHLVRTVLHHHRQQGHIVEPVLLALLLYQDLGLGPIEEHPPLNLVSIEALLFLVVNTINPLHLIPRVITPIDTTAGVTTAGTGINSGEEAAQAHG